MEARRTKRSRDASEVMSLEEHISSHRSSLVKARKEAPSLRREASELVEKSSKMDKRWQIRVKKDMLELASDLVKEADLRESMVREHEYETKVVSYLRMYNRKVEAVAPSMTSRKQDTIEAYIKQTDITGQRKSAILDEYLVDMNQAPPKVAMATRDECPRCNTKLLLCTHKSIMTCSECGYSMTYLDATSSSTSFDEVVEYSQYSYKRANHFQGWIALCQGKEAHRVPMDVLNDVMAELYRQRIRDPNLITQKKVREILRRLKLRKSYDHVAQITARLSGVPPLKIGAETEEKLRIMFLQMQPAFEKHAPKTRTNFLSYSYVLYRCFQIMGINHMLEGLTLLKGRDKLEMNDAIFKKMCKDLGWPIFDLPGK